MTHSKPNGFRSVARAISGMIRAHPLVSELPAAALFAMGAILIQVGITEVNAEDGATLSRNVWFNSGLVTAILGVALAFLVPIVYVVAAYRHQAFVAELGRLLKDANTLEARYRASTDRQSIRDQVINWANTVDDFLDKQDPGLKAYFRNISGLPSFSYKNVPEEESPRLNYLVMHKQRLAEIFLRVKAEE